VLAQPSYERLTEAAERDVDLAPLLARLPATLPLENVPACVSGRAPRKRPEVLDASTLQPDGQMEIFRFTKRYILSRYYTKSLRCKSCVHDSECSGMHINYVRAHGFGSMQPVAP
jgi:hypothetical protein